MKSKMLNEGPKNYDEFVTWRQMATHYRNRCEQLEAELDRLLKRRLPPPIEEKVEVGEVFSLPRGLM